MIQDIQEGADISPEEFRLIDKTNPIDHTEHVISDGRRAELLLNDDLLKAAFNAVAQRYHHLWANSPRGDIAAQQAAHYSLAALKDVEGMIRSYVRNGKLATQKRDAKQNG